MMKAVTEGLYNQQVKDRGIDPTATLAKCFELQSNYSGTSGELLIKRIMSEKGAKVINEDVTHDFYDVKASYDGLSEKTYEIKTARMDLNGNFQFDGITPENEFDFIILLAVKPEGILFNMQHRSSFSTLIDESNGPYAGKKRWKLFKKLTPMHKGTLDGGLKLTMSQKDLNTYGFEPLDELACDKIISSLKV